jgi:hypothetical protein
MLYYIRSDKTGIIEGPLPADEIRTGITAGRWSADALVVAAGGQSKFELDSGKSNWVSASSLDGAAAPAQAAESDSSTPDLLAVAANDGASPALEPIFKVLAGLQVASGIVLGAQLWPGEPQIGYEWRTVAYVPALTWIAAGFIFGCLFWAAGDVLKYLHRIDRSLRRTANR